MKQNLGHTCTRSRKRAVYRDRQLRATARTKRMSAERAEFQFSPSQSTSCVKPKRLTDVSTSTTKTVPDDRRKQNGDVQVGGLHSFVRDAFLCKAALYTYGSFMLNVSHLFKLPHRKTKFILASANSSSTCSQHRNTKALPYCRDIDFARETARLEVITSRPRKTSQ